MKQTAPVEVSPHVGSIEKLLPKSVDKYALIVSEATVQGYYKSLQTWAAVYQSGSDQKPRFRLYIQNFRNSDDAYSGLVGQTMSRKVGGEITAIETTVKNGKNVGTKICLRKYGSSHHCEDVLWTDGSIMVAMWSEDFNTESEPLYQLLPF